ncbi:PilN domain-containing protein [Hydrogenophaga pseudoflava]|jgi:type IV pilus assembly protein PilN|uniref:Fimbrial assembly protein (PilN) n=1 Tax=Hydrogenophaga pseudoflava TaxID=47421 RepID=A0A4P6X430_HYDPS|nr:PilN domain-containing protein [Hydrogenophaga pseudoflava]QBM29949.1 Fimbrial assembly protein (PilN) [Hydrogenophaga pseudoflava]
MILINLLPHREATRKRRKEQFFTQLGLSALLGGIICGAVYTWYQGRIADQQARNSFLKQETARLDAEIKDIATLQAQIASLRARQTAVEDLQADRNMPVHLLEELVGELPDGIYLRSMKQESQSVLLTGTAQSQERVSDFLRSLSTKTKWLIKPELVEIVAANASVSSKEQRRVSNFTIRAMLNRPSSTSKAPESTVVKPSKPAARSAASSKV